PSHSVVHFFQADDERPMVTVQVILDYVQLKCWHKIRSLVHTLLSKP
ncbi:unnamed protein product, partial [marine sediment metagenome]